MQVNIVKQGVGAVGLEVAATPPKKRALEQPKEGQKETTAPAPAEISVMEVSELVYVMPKDLGDLDSMRGIERRSIELLNARDEKFQDKLMCAPTALLSGQHHTGLVGYERQVSWSKGVHPNYDDTIEVFDGLSGAEVHVKLPEGAQLAGFMSTVVEVVEFMKKQDPTCELDERMFIISNTRPYTGKRLKNSTWEPGAIGIGFSFAYGKIDAQAGADLRGRREAARQQDGEEIGAS